MRQALVPLAVALAAAAGAVAAVPDPAPTLPKATGLPKDQCILTRDLGNHSVVDQNTMIWGAVGRSKGLYRVTMRNGCLRSAVSADPIGIRQIGGGKICAPKDLVLTARSGLCDIASIVKLTPEEDAALPRRLRP